MALVVTHRVLCFALCAAVVSCRDPSPSAGQLNTGARVAALPPTQPPPPENRPVPPSEAPSAPPVAGRSEFVELLVGPDPGPAGRIAIVALHGLGDTPENFSNWLRAAPISARVLVVRAPETYGGGNAWWQPGGDEATVARGIDRAARVVKERLESKLGAATMCGTPIVLGFSQGAMVSFAIAARGEMSVRLVVPIAGRLPVENRGVTRPAASRPRVRAMHGDADERIAIAAGRSTVEALARQGLDATLRSFAGVGHAIPDEVRAAVFDEITRAATEMGCGR
jgi:phospholipase/carboxylesterase